MPFRFFRALTSPAHFTSPLATRQQKIAAFHIDRGAQLTLLFSHGNAEDLGMVYDWFREVSRELDVNVLAYDYTGYGLNTGPCSEEDCFADIEAAFNYATDVLNVPPGRIVLYGRSLGSGPSCHLARQQSVKGSPVCGVVLQSPLMSAYRVAFHFRWTMPGDVFANIDKVAEVRSPVFILHGSRDEVVPYWHGQELYLALQEPFRYKPFWVEGAGHNNIEMMCREDCSFFNRLNEFLDFLAPRRGEGDGAAMSLKDVLARSPASKKMATFGGGARNSGVSGGVSKLYAAKA